MTAAIRTRLAALKALADAATSAPWSVPHFAGEGGCQCRYVLADGYCGSVCTVDVGNGLKIGEGGNDAPPLEEAKANGRLIAAARTALPELVGLLEKALDVVDTVRIYADEVDSQLLSTALLAFDSLAEKEAHGE